MNIGCVTGRMGLICSVGVPVERAVESSSVVANVRDPRQTRIAPCTVPGSSSES